MKHIFVINPHAGKVDATSVVRSLVDGLAAPVETELYITRSIGDATDFVRQRLNSADGEVLRFYACGGDGTLNEVVSGMVGYPLSEVTCLPVGSGNDYVKYYGGKDLFLDLQRLVDGDVKEVDVMRVNDSYAVNVCNFGFDAMVCKTMMEVRRKPIIGGRNAYTTGIVKALIKGRRTTCQIRVDDKEVHNGDMLLCTMGNGRYVGGAYQCSPLSENDDGLIEVCLFKPMSILTFARLIGSYRDGTFISRPDVQNKMTYLRGTTIDIESPEPIDLCVDGEMMHDSRFHIEQITKAVRFVVPNKIC